jgi:hypothetical protein
MCLFFRIISYLSELLIPALHQEEIYNYDRITETGVTPLYDTKLLGLVRIRQLRVKNGTYSPQYFIASRYADKALHYWLKYNCQ